MALLVTSVMSWSAFAQDLKGDAYAGEKKTAMCVGCHGMTGYRASFPEVHKVPLLGGQSASYIVAALKAYKSGERKHPSMRGIASDLSEQDIADLAAYYTSAGASRTAMGQAASDVNQAEALLAKGACVSCHGKGLSNPISPAYPYIAGQYPDYLYVALKAYKTTDRELIGRGNPVMAGVAKQFSNQELKVLAEYVASLPTRLKTVQSGRIQ